jgi:amino acid efflux transporter
VAVTSVIVTVLYLGTAASVVLTGTYGTDATDRVAIGRLLQSVFRGGASLVAAMIALIISLGTTNAFVAGLSRLGHSLAHEGWLPAPVSRVTRAGVPAGGVMAVATIAVAGLATGWIRSWGTEPLVVVPSTLVVAVYLLAAAAGFRLLTGTGKFCAGLTLVMTGSILPTALEHAAIAVATVILALLAHRLFRRTAAVEVRPAEPRPGPGRAPSARR